MRSHGGIGADLCLSWFTLVLLLPVAFASLYPNNYTAAEARSKGFVSVVAGNGTAGFVDGEADVAQFRTPLGLTISSSGLLYVADADNHAIRSCTDNGTVATVAGGNGKGYQNGGLAVAKLYYPMDVAIDAADSIVYIVDSGNHVIRALDIASGIVSTLAGVPETRGFNDGAAASALFYAPRSVCVAWGGLVISDRFNHRLRFLDLSLNQVTTLAGGASPGHADGILGVSTIEFPSAVAYSVNDDAIWFVQQHCVRKMADSSTTFLVTTIAGSCTTQGFTNDLGTAARFFIPKGIFEDAAGRVFVAEAGGNALRWFSNNASASTFEEVYTVAGTRSDGRLDGDPSEALFSNPVAVVAAGEVSNTSWLYVAEPGSHTIRRISATCLSPCQNGAACISPGVCDCLSGYQGAQCQTPICSVACTGGQVCAAPDTCACPTGYSGANCLVPVCAAPCHNGGSCASPDACSCTSGWNGADCTDPICTSACQNSGTCVAPDTCNCTIQWSGTDCTTPVCALGCANGGTCISPDVCSCASGWEGVDCTQAICSPSCANNGTCIAPDTCNCTSDWQGVDCTTPACVLACLNGGVCSDPSVCECAAGWTGTQCETPVCDPACMHGAPCSAPNTCDCSANWTGVDCSEPVCSPSCPLGEECIAPDTCVTMCAPACVHGYCVGRNNCTCLDGYEGADCSYVPCDITCVNGHCGTPNNCSCMAGWSGTACERPVCPQLCFNGGECVAPHVCECASGWTGANCTLPLCADSPAGCLNGGRCIAPGKCRCKFGWVGSVCDFPLCNMTCFNGGVCDAPNHCECEPGFVGDDCSMVTDTNTGGLSKGTLVAIVIVWGAVSGAVLAAVLVRFGIDRKRYKDYLKELKYKAEKQELSHAESAGSIVDSEVAYERKFGWGGE